MYINNLIKRFDMRSKNPNTPDKVSFNFYVEPKVKQAALDRAAREDKSLGHVMRKLMTEWSTGGKTDEK